jgi:hypothetical protein
MVLAAGIAACDGNIVDPGVRAVDLVVTSGPAGSAGAVGYTTFTAELRLVGPGNRSTPAGEEPGAAIALLDGTDTVRILVAEVADAGYAGVRIVFREVQAQVDGGLVVDGAPLTGLVTVEPAQGDSIVVDRTLALPQGPAPLRILLDVRAREWLAATDADHRTVPADRFASAIRIGTW